MAETASLDLVRRLCKALDGEGLRYCHWKSNAMLARSASGENDLDLLVARSDARAFTEILYRLGFKEAHVPPARQLPGILHYYGYDADGDAFVHVHAHYQLVLGDDMTKGYHLPVEGAYLESAAPHGLFRVPAPEFELLLLVVRLTLKYSTWDAMLRGQGRVPRGARVELEYLEDRADPARLEAVRAAHLPALDPDLLARCRRSLEPDCPRWRRAAAAAALRRRLAAYARRPPATDLYLKHSRRAAIAVRRLLRGRSGGKRLATGGAMIAVVGGDGAGKSTAVQDLHAWLARAFAVRILHLGKPFRPSPVLALWHRLGIGRRLGALPGASLAGPRLAGEGGGRASGFGRHVGLLRCVLVARARYRAYARGRRFASNGGLVVCDRYPLPRVTLMDGARTPRLADAHRRGALARALARAEARYYRRIGLPEVLLVLRVHPDVAVRRKPEEDPDAVRRRGQEIWDLDWRDTPAHVVDAGRRRDEVLSELKGVIWSRI